MTSSAPTGSQRSSSSEAAIDLSQGLEIFKHRHLSLDKGQIRLFKFHPHITDGEALSATGSTDIFGSMETFDLESHPTYQALSYEWGSEEDLQIIYIDGKPFTVRKNLHDFFRTMRHAGFSLLLDADSCPGEPDVESGACYFWVDQLCIDQANVSERNHQVSLMADIYSQAERVVSWLGICPGPCITSLRFPNEASGPQDPHHINFTKAIFTHLANSTYWDRLWAVQEVLLAEDNLFVCGSQSATAEDIAIYERNEEALDAYIECQTSDEHLRMYHLKELSISLGGPPEQRVYTLVEAFSSFANLECSEVRDHVYALQSLVAPQHRIIADYRIDRKDLFKQVIKSCMAQLTRDEIGRRLQRSKLPWSSDQADICHGLESLCDNLGLNELTVKDIYYLWQSMYQEARTFRLLELGLPDLS